MSNAVAFLETMAGRPLHAWNGDEYDAAVAALDVEPAQRRALLERDGDGLAALLRARATMFCMVMTPDGGETEAPLDAPDRDDDADDDRDDDRHPGGDRDPADGPVRPD